MGYTKIFIGIYQLKEKWLFVRNLTRDTCGVVIDKGNGMWEMCAWEGFDNDNDKQIYKEMSFI